MVFRINVGYFYSILIFCDRGFTSPVFSPFFDRCVCFSGRRVIFLSGDDDDAKGEVGGLFEAAGFVAIDLGGLREGGRMQQFRGPLAGLNLIRLG